MNSLQLRTAFRRLFAQWYLLGLAARCLQFTLIFEAVSHGVGAAWMGAVMAASSVACAVFTIYAGRLYNRFGPSPLNRCAALCCAGAGFLATQHEVPAALAVAWMLTGMTLMLAATAGYRGIGGLFDAADRVSRFSRMCLLSNVSEIAMPVAIGALFSQAPDLMPFIVLAVSLALSFLSSGVDSSYVACSANVDKTFTVGFDNGTKYNEISYAEELSRQIPVKNISKIITPEEFWSTFPKIQYHMDEPLADPAAVALYFVCNTAAQHLKVVLSGEGADEIFGGYNIYREPLECAWYDKIPFPIRKLVGKAASLLPAHRGLNFLVRRGKRLEERFIGNAYMFSEKERKSLLKHPTDAQSPAALVKPYYDMVQDKDAVTKMQFVDLNMWMVGDILLKADKMSMANSLELRVPFLDKEIMALAGRIPLKYRVNEENTKYAMRKAALRRMPEKWAGKKKLGFPVPTRVWLKEEKYYNMVKEEFTGSNAEKFFHTEKLIKLLDDHRAGKADNSRRVWTVYTFLIWYKQFFPEAA